MKVKAPKEDPKIKAAREAEERRADAAFIENTSELLDEETRRRIRKFGARSRARAVTGAGGGARGGRAFGGTNTGGSTDPSDFSGFASRPSGPAGGAIQSATI